MRLAVLVSGRGSNLSALLEAIDRGRCPARVVVVISDRKKAPALETARGRGIDTVVVRPRDHATRADWDAALARATAAAEPDLVVLAGFMRLVGAPVLDRFGGRLINVHPSLLPAFPGRDAPTEALAAGVKVTGCTVHVVDAGVDTGTILAQAAVAVVPGDDRAALHARIQRCEHRLLPAVVSAIARGDLQLAPAVRWAPRVTASSSAALVSPDVEDA